MKILFYSIRECEIPYLSEVNQKIDEPVYLPETLSLSTAEKAAGFEAISVAGTDEASDKVLERLFKNGVRIIAIRAAAHDRVAISKANELGITVTHIPGYASFAVAEYAVALLLALNRKIVLSDRQIHKQDFSTGTQSGFDLQGKTAGVIGVGNTGSIFVKIMHGFGCRILGFDLQKSRKVEINYGLTYVTLEDVCRESDIISMHIPLTDQTKHLISKKQISQMKKGVILINTSNSACVHAVDVLEGLQTGRIGAFGADGYEDEEGVSIFDHPPLPVLDTVLAGLLELKNVIITPHRAYATEDVLSDMARSVFRCFRNWKEHNRIPNQLTHVRHMSDPATYVDDEEA